jgi:hypothetical protein
MNDDAQQPAPGSTGATPSPKKHRGSNANAITAQRTLDKLFATPSPKKHRGSNANAITAQRTLDKLFASNTRQKEITNSEVAVGGEL